MTRLLLPLAAVIAVGGCVVPLVDTRLEPVPVAGHGSPPLKAQIRKAALSIGLFRGGTKLSSGSRLAVEIDLHNADAQRTLTVRAPRLVLRDALGGPEITGQPVATGDGSLPGELGTSDAPLETRPLALRPHETKTVWIAYAGFPEDGPRGPMRAVVHVQADGESPLELAIADPVPGGPRWKSDKLALSLGIGGAVSTFETGTRSGRSDAAVAPLSLELLLSWDRLFWGLTSRYELLYRETVAGGPLVTGGSFALTAGFLPWRFPVGFYGQAGVLIAAETPPAAYAQIDGSEGGAIHLPRAGGGLVFNLGPQLSSASLLPIERRLSPLRKVQIRIGYTQWFRLGSAAGAGAIEVGVVALIGP